MQRLCLIACGIVASGDALQVVLSGPSVGAVGGCLLYLGLAIGHVRHQRWAAWATLVIPLLPTALLVGWLIGVRVPRAPDGWMVSLYAVQLVGAVSAAALLRQQRLTGR